MVLGSHMGQMCFLFPVTKLVKSLHFNCGQTKKLVGCGYFPARESVVPWVPCERNVPYNLIGLNPVTRCNCISISLPNFVLLCLFPTFSIHFHSKGLIGMNILKNNVAKASKHNLSKNFLSFIQLSDQSSGVVTWVGEKAKDILLLTQCVQQN